MYRSSLPIYRYICTVSSIATLPQGVVALEKGSEMKVLFVLDHPYGAGASETRLAYHGHVDAVVRLPLDPGQPAA